MKIKAIYDNGGETLDRYTVVYTTKGLRYPSTAYDCIRMSELPSHPQGFYQHSTCQMGKHLGKKIQLLDLPMECIKALYNEHNFKSIDSSIGE